MAVLGTFALIAKLATMTMAPAAALTAHEAPRRLSAGSGGPGRPLHASSPTGRHGPPDFPLACVDGMTCPIQGKSPGTTLKQLTGKNMSECWQACVAKTNCLGAISLINGVCNLLDRTYDGNYATKTVCDTWVSNKDASATCAGCDTSLTSPQECPTPAPTPAPTPPPSPAPSSSAGAATAFGDPHVGNLRGEKFDILRAGYHDFLAIPRGSSDDDERSLLRVRAKVSPSSGAAGPCSGDAALYVTELRFRGRWLGAARSLEFITSVDGEMDAGKAIRVRLGSSPAPASLLNVSAFRASVPPALAEVTELYPKRPEAPNQHVETLLVKLRLGPSISKVRMVYQKEKQGYFNALWLTSTGLGKIEEEIGGILGVDDHSLAATQPPGCAAPAAAVATGSSKRRSQSLGAGSVHALATLELEEEETVEGEH